MKLKRKGKYQITMSEKELKMLEEFFWYIKLEDIEELQNRLYAEGKYKKDRYDIHQIYATLTKFGVMIDDWFDGN